MMNTAGMNEREFELFERVIDRAATADDWSAIAGSAQDDASVWSRLNAALRADDAVRDCVADAVSAADRVNPGIGSGETLGSGAMRRRRVVHGIFAFSGWAAAAMILLAAIVWINGGNVTTERTTGEPLVIAPADLTLDEAFTRYLRAGLAEGRIVDELPIMMMSARPAEGGEHVEVLYMRRIVERATVEDENVLKLATDEHGRIVPVPAPDAFRTTSSSL